MTHHVDLTTVTLKKGAHEAKTPGEWCVMEAAAYFAHEPWSAHPQCVSPVIGAFLRRWNDDLDDVGRQMLVPYIEKVVGTNTGGDDDDRRAWMVTDWMVRTYLPAWLRLAKLEEQAVALVDLGTWRTMEPTISRVRKDSAAAWAAAGDAAWDALRPTTEGLQKSALDLLDRLIAVGE